MMYVVVVLDGDLEEDLNLLESGSVYLFVNRNLFVFQLLVQQIDMTNIERLCFGSQDSICK
jgi:hypothetical protein